jgi:hypothetical protein
MKRPPMRAHGRVHVENRVAKRADVSLGKCPDRRMVSNGKSPRTSCIAQQPNRTAVYKCDSVNICLSLFRRLRFRRKVMHMYKNLKRFNYNINIIFAL